ncbi:hypothetical protein [Enterobacter sichuanensis]|uniref:hypothetical protein n=1 Tax=Enterobacter sichuanensis TaxID=2071710 RepID=UPI002909BBAA|nr:hypothetical protein [Enterobacter sichuanensis]MDU5196888.1 hypothetical protein [Enterobacter sichuanensis]MDU5389490.1 hypothetical protein [Enterobacter sichuanensis]
MRNILILAFVTFLFGCTDRARPADEIDHESGLVKIFSTKNLNAAQDRADILCSKKSYYVKALHESNLMLLRNNPSDVYLFDYIPFQCDLKAAANGGNSEAKALYDKNLTDAYRKLEESKRNQYEAHKAYAKKHGIDSYSIVNPDGSIEAHTIDSNGDACHSAVSIFGWETVCN